MNNTELVSIIVPVYNVEKYIKKCIESLISQNYKNIEIILVDDGSSDKSAEIIDTFAYIDSRIILTLNLYVYSESGEANALFEV